MTVSTRLAVLTLMVGFLIEGVGEAFEFVSKQWLLSHVPHALLDIYYIGPATTVLGFLFAFMGRHEWSETHRQHVIHGHKVLGFAIVTLGTVAGAFALLVYEYPTAVVPTFLPWTLGILTAIGLGASFVSYMLICYHITSQRGKAFLGGSVAWGAVVSAWAGITVGSNFGTILAALRSDPGSLASTVNNLTFVTTVLCVSYFLLAVGYHDAYRLLLRGILPEGHVPAKKYRGPSRTSSAIGGTTAPAGGAQGSPPSASP